MRLKFLIIAFLTSISLAGCGNANNTDETVSTNVNSQKAEIEEKKDEIIMNTEKVKALDCIKNPKDHNPVMTQKYSADPYAMVFDGRVYLYMTGDEPMYEADGSLKVNNYSNINTIRVISSDDLVNWTDHGEVYAAGANGAASWGNNSWAPAACVKVIDGTPKFFLYFANSGNGIAVLTSDSPVGPFVDPLGEALVSRKTPTCAEVTWLFDPAVLVDDDGTGYLYFGGGIPSDDKIPNPGTARVAKLTDDMIHLAEDPKPIEDVLYLFEDSGINKVGDKYIYSYCSNFNVPAKGCEGYGFGSGEIITMVSDNPMGPFTMVGSILKNPEYFFKNGGNNHHCMFEFEGKWYVTYHASLIEEKLGRTTGYRSVNVDTIEINEDGLFAVATGTKAGVEQLKNFDPYALNSFVTMSNQVGTEKAAADDLTLQNGSGTYDLKIVQDGSWIELSNVDFKDGAKTLTVSLKSKNAGSVSVRTELLNSEDKGRLYFDSSEEFASYEINLDTAVSGVQDLFFVFEGEGCELKDWQFK